jgi:cytochrome c-type biogenesis protein CcmH
LIRPALALLLAAGAIAAPVAGAAEPQTNLPDVEDEVMCPICGTSLEQSESPQAERERELIRRLIAAGRSKDEIKDALVAQYGPDVLAEPEGEGFDLAAWVVPIIGFGIALAAVGFLLARRRHDAEPPTPPPAPEPAEAARLSEDMSRYDL